MAIKEREVVWVVLRLDLPLEGEIQNRITVKEVLPTVEEAQAECERLQGLSDARDATRQRDRTRLYFTQASRYYSGGRHVETKY